MCIDYLEQGSRRVDTVRGKVKVEFDMIGSQKRIKTVVCQFSTVNKPRDNKDIYNCWPGFYMGLILHWSGGRLSGRCLLFLAGRGLSLLPQRFCCEKYLSLVAICVCAVAFKFAEST